MLPDKWDYRVKPTIKWSWRRAYPHQRDEAFWWRVGYVVRAKRIRHRDMGKIRDVCAAVDAAFPEHRRICHGSGYDCADLPRA